MQEQMCFSSLFGVLVERDEPVSLASLTSSSLFEKPRPQAGGFFIAFLVVSYSIN